VDNNFFKNVKEWFQEYGTYTKDLIIDIDLLLILALVVRILFISAMIGVLIAFISLFS